MAAMRYFHISTGLRGCYMPDSSYVVACKTRRDLKAAIDSEASRYAESGYVGANKRAIAWLAAESWRDYVRPGRAYLPRVLPVAPPHAKTNYCEGVFCSHASRADYLESLKESEQ